MAELYSVDEKVCELIDIRFNFQGLKASGVVLTFYECVRVGEPFTNTIETFTKCWNFPNPVKSDRASNVVPPSTKLQALGQLGIKPYQQQG